MLQIYRIRGVADVELREDEPIKLLEVNENTVPAGIMPLRFGALPADGIVHSSIIIEVTPSEFERLQNRELVLPNGWKVEELLPRSRNDEAA